MTKHSPNWISDSMLNIYVQNSMLKKCPFEKTTKEFCEALPLMTPIKALYTPENEEISNKRLKLVMLI